MAQLLFFVREGMIRLIIFELVEPAMIGKPLYKAQGIATAFGWLIVHKNTF